ARARAGPGPRGATHARVARAGRPARHRGAQCGRPRGAALRAGLVGTRATAASLALHAGDGGRGHRAGRGSHGLDLASGEATVLPLEPGLLAARSWTREAGAS